MLVYQTGVEVLSLMPSLLMRRESLSSSKVSISESGFVIPSLTLFSLHFELSLIKMTQLQL